MLLQVLLLSLYQLLRLSHLSLLLLLYQLISLLNRLLPASLPVRDLVLPRLHAQRKPLEQFRIVHAQSRLDLLRVDALQVLLDEVHRLVRLQCLVLQAVRGVSDESINKLVIEELPGGLPEELVGAFEADLLSVVAQEVEDRLP